MAMRHEIDLATSKSPTQTTRPEKDNQAHAGRTNDDYFDLSSMKNVTVNLKEIDEHLLSPDSDIEVCEAVHILLPLVKERYKFGICAKIEPSDLDLIMERYPEPVQCLSNIVDRWNRASHTRSWSALASAVEKMHSYEQVALSLRRMTNKDREREYMSDGNSVDGLKSVTTVENHQLEGNADSTNDKSPPQSFLRFKCAGSGECTIYEHFEGKKCDNHTKHYPYLEVRGKPYETDIEIYLEEQTDKMRDSFANLMQDTRKQLQESATSPYTEIQGYVKLLTAGKSGYDRIKNTTNLYELQDALIETCCSWFNHGIIAKIRKTFLHKNGSDHILERYIQDFEDYCKRRCFESPAALHPEIDLSTEKEIQNLVFKVEQDFYTSTLTDILQAKRAVAKILGCPPHAINVCSVKQGCIEVHCQVLPIATINSISDEQVHQLFQQNIISFKVEEEELMPVKKDEETDTLTTETKRMQILELTQSPTNYNRKVFTLTFPSQPPITNSRNGSNTTETVTPIVTATENRHKVICKIMDTERKYLRHLQVLLNGYLPAVKEVSSPQEIRMLFPAQLEPMMERHEELLSQLESRMESSNHSPTIIGDIFASFFNSELLSMYSAYMKEFKVAVKMLAKCKQNSPQFSEQLSMCQNSFFCEGLSLASYLLTPVQRLPRYELLIKELLKHTPARHPDSCHIVEVVDKLDEGLIRLNHSIKLCLLACSVQQVQNQKSLRGIRKLTSQRQTQQRCHMTEDLEELTRRAEGEGGVAERDSHKRDQGSIKSTTTSRPTQYTSRLARNCSILSASAHEHGVWIRSRLSINSNSSSTTGYGSMSTNTSQLDLTFHPMTPSNEQIPILSFASQSALTSIYGSKGPCSSLQKDRGKVIEDEGSCGTGVSIGRFKSWTTSRLKKKGSISTIDLTDLHDHAPSLYWSEESIAEAAMRWEEEERFGYFMEARMSVSCSDLLLSLSHFSDKTKNLKPAQHAASENRPSISAHPGQCLSGETSLQGCSIAKDQGHIKMAARHRSLSSLSLYSNSSTATSGIDSASQSQLDLTVDSTTTGQLRAALEKRLCTSMPTLSVTAAASEPIVTSTRVRAFSYSPLPPATATHS